MRSLIAGIVLSASIAALGPTQAQTRHHRSPGYESAQASMSHRRQTHDELQPTGADLERVAGSNRGVRLQSGPQSFDGAPVHPWSPIYGGVDHQPTEYELNASHEQDVTGTQAREIARLNRELLSSANQILRQYPAPAR